MTRRIGRVATLIGFLVLVLVGETAAGTAAMTDTPQNGRIVFDGWGCLGTTCSASMAAGYDLWSVNPDGSGLVNLTPTPGIDADADWSPDGRTILFNSDRHGDYDLFLMDPDGSDVRRLTSAVGGETYPTWSPDGTRIAYVYDGRRSQDIMVMRADGSRKRRIASFPAGFWAYALEWSPTGRWIAFSKGEATLTPTQPHKSYLMRPDGSELHRLAPRDWWAVFPSWSPDGRRLVFSGDPCAATDPCNARMWMVRRGGRAPRRVIAEETTQWRPEWSPDGTQIAYTSRGSDPVWRGDLWIVDIDGSNNHEVITKPDSYDWGAAWQPLPQ